jgi:hypothetical protein
MSPPLVVPIDRAQRRVDVDERALGEAGPQRHPLPERHRCARPTAASWLAWPKVNSRKEIPNKGRIHSSNNLREPPARSTLPSSMLSAPLSARASSRR